MCALRCHWRCEWQRRRTSRVAVASNASIANQFAGKNFFQTYFCLSVCFFGFFFFRHNRQCVRHKNCCKTSIFRMYTSAKSTTNSTNIIITHMASLENAKFRKKSQKMQPEYAVYMGCIQLEMVSNIIIRI